MNKRFTLLKGAATADTVLTFGKHKGKALKEVPVSYLVWMYEKNVGPAVIQKYVEDNYETFKKHAS